MILVECLLCGAFHGRGCTGYEMSKPLLLSRNLQSSGEGTKKWTHIVTEVLAEKCVLFSEMVKKYFMEWLYLNWVIKIELNSDEYR